MTRFAEELTARSTWERNPRGRCRRRCRRRRRRKRRMRRRRKRRRT